MIVIANIAGINDDEPKLQRFLKPKFNPEFVLLNRVPVPREIIIKQEEMSGKCAF